MKALRADFDKIIKLNNLKDNLVNDPIFLKKGFPTDNGLFSNKIFGITQDDRSTIWGYVELNGKFLHPLAYIALKRLNRSFEHIMMGTKKFIVNSKGELEENEEGSTGLMYLYDIFDKLSFKETESIVQKERIELLSYKKDEVFIDKFLILPPFYRDLSTGDRGEDQSTDVINDLYSTMIRLSNSLKEQSVLPIFTTMTRAKLQTTIFDIYDHYVNGEISKKLGMFRRFVMGKNVDYGARLVISSARLEVDTVEDMQVTFRKMGLPLSIICALANPFVVAAVKQFFDNEFVKGAKYPYFDSKTGEKKYVTLIEPEVEYSETYIRKMIKKFIKGYSTRFEPIHLPKNEEGLDLEMFLEGTFDGKSTISHRVATWTDILYIVIEDLCQTKHTYITRYPLEDYFGIAPGKISVLTTLKTIPVLIGDKLYRHYPVVNPGGDSSSLFLDTLQMSNTRLKGFGADFDGKLIAA